MTARLKKLRRLSRNRPTKLARQRGGALLIVIFIAAIAVMSVLIGKLNSASQKAAQLANIASAQLDAKNALLGYVRTNGAPDFWGVLPLPDMGKRDANPHIEGESPANFGADAARGLLANGIDHLLIGRLPGKTLGSSAFRDNTGHCLWYGLSAAFRSTHRTWGSVTFNWDTLGDFETNRSDNPHESRAIAVIFAAGAPNNLQDRSPSGFDSVAECGGNYVVGNYLEGLTVNPSNPTTDANQAVYPLAAAQPSPDTPPAAAITIALTANTDVTTDHVLPITAREIFSQVASAGTLQTSINTLLPLLKSCLEAKSLPSIGIGLVNSIPAGQSRYFGPLAPSGTASNQIDCLATITGTNAMELARWRDNIWYLTCNTPYSGCLQLTDTTNINGIETCDGLIAFSGARTGTQRRSNAAEKTDPEQYFEIDPANPNSPDIVNAFRPVVVTAIKARSSLSANPDELSQDVALCLKRPSSESNPKIDIAKFSDVPPTIVGVPLVSRDLVSEIVTLGNTASGAKGVGATFSDTVPVVSDVVSASNTEIALPATANAANNFYSGMPVEIISGPGFGQTRTIITYNGTSKTATVNLPWNALPSATSSFRIVALSDNVAAVSAVNTELKLPPVAVATSDFYNGMSVEIMSGPGAGQVRTITSYIGPSKTANVDTAWATLPTASSTFRILALNGNPIAARNPKIVSASSLSTAHIGFAVEITQGTGAGQSRVIADYDSATQTAGLESNWDTIPDSSSILKVDLGMPPFGKGLRVYFRARILQQTATFVPGPGFVFALFDADRNLDSNGVPTALVSGGAGNFGQYLGYAGRNLDINNSAISPPIEYPKFGLEFDTARNTGTADTTGNHIAFVYWGRSHDWPDPQPVSPYDDDNTHGVPVAQTGYIDPFNASAFVYTALRDPSAINRDFHVRFEITRQYPFAANVGRYVSRVWIVKTVDGMIPGMDNIKQDFTTISALPPQHTQTIDITDRSGPLLEAFRHFRFGFTNAQATRTQEIKISDLRLRLR